jgi:hypothetical protein
VLVVLGYLVPVPPVVVTLGWICLVIGVVLLLVGQINGPVGGRRYWW